MSTTRFSVHVSRSTRMYVLLLSKPLKQPYSNWPTDEAQTACWESVSSQVSLSRGTTGQIDAVNVFFYPESQGVIQLFAQCSHTACVFQTYLHIFYILDILLSNILQPGRGTPSFNWPEQVAVAPYFEIRFFATTVYGFRPELNRGECFLQTVYMPP